MQNKTVSILSTRPIAQSLINEADARGIAVDIVSFIETSPVVTAEVAEQIKAASQHYNTVVFTSMNAVEAVIHQLEGSIPNWNIYCMGNTTKNLVLDYFGDQAIVAVASSAVELAGEIVVSAKNKEIVFFCGNQRRAELPDILNQHHFSVNEIVVYNTIETSRTITKEYDGILFFSPSAVHSFFVQNKAAQEVFFAIGETTANAIEKYTANKIIISKSPAKDELLKQAIEEFSHD